ncbi:MAG: YlxR family protein [Anaerolineaceae bacterium]
MSKKSSRHKHIPQRTCVGCRQVMPKRQLIRIVRQSEGIEIDLTGKLPGRGAYLHNVYSCWEKGLKGALAQALKTEITMEDKKKLSAFAKTLIDNPFENKDA